MPDGDIEGSKRLAIAAEMKQSVEVRLVRRASTGWATRPGSFEGG